MSLTKCVLLGALAVCADPGLCRTLAQCEQAKLTASDAAGNQRLGRSVSVSGDYAVVTRGAGGSVYVFHNEGTQWVEQMRIDGFLGPVAIFGDRFVIGDAGDDEAGANAGAVHVFRRDGTSWVPDVKLTASDADPGDVFGRSVALEGNTLVVGAPGDDDNAGEAGAVYVLVWDGISWTEQQKLTSSDSASLDLLGSSVSVSGDVLIAAAPQIHPIDSPGKAYIFRRIGSSWNEEFKAFAAEPQIFEWFASSVAISGDVAVVGVPAFGSDEDPTRPGSAYVYAYDGNTWVEETVLTSGESSIFDDFFGNSVAMTGDVLVVGAPQGDQASTTGTGTAHVFQRIGSAWRAVGKLSRADATVVDFFGNSVAIASGLAIVSAEDDDDACPKDLFCNSGSAYLFSLPDCGVLAIPAVSTWGMVILTALLLCAGTVVCVRRSRYASLGSAGDDDDAGQ